MKLTTSKDKNHHSLKVLSSIDSHYLIESYAPWCKIAVTVVITVAIADHGNGQNSVIAERIAIVIN
jgi:hypothetical protein